MRLCNPFRIVRAFRAVERRLLGVLLPIALAVPGGVVAQTPAYPSRPITLVSPFAAGGTSDTIARALARELEGDLKQTVLVVNRPGAGGTIGVASVVNAAPDGYTLVLGGLGSIVFPSVVHKGRIKYDPAKDLVPIGSVGVAPTVIVARGNLPASTLAEFVALARTQPNKFSFASAGVGGTLHLAGVLLERDAGIALNHVPYRGGAPAMTDVAAGTVDLALADLTLAQPFLQSGKIRPLAIASHQRSPALPGVPTTAEVGFKGVRMDTWYGLFAAAATPADVLDRLQAALERARKGGGFEQALKTQGINPVTFTAAEFKSSVQQDFDRWIPLLTRVCGESSCD
jgi:tripartite-type tricarboxylate transporter receptor subunit TctC